MGFATVRVTTAAALAGALVVGGLVVTPAAHAAIASSKVKKGHVISQRPRHGKRVKQHTRIGLLVSKG
jgi:beta-lactam-binding protein with PASTA domain